MCPGGDIARPPACYIPEPTSHVSGRYMCICLQEESGDLWEGSELAAAWRPEVRVMPHDLAASLRRHARHAPDLPVVKQLGL